MSGFCVCVYSEPMNSEGGCPECGYKKQSCFWSTLQSILVWFSPYPIYTIIIGILIKEECLGQFNPITLLLTLCLFFIFEICHMLLFTPPKMKYMLQNYSEIEMVSFEDSCCSRTSRNEGRSVSMGLVHNAHLAVSLASILTVAYVGIHVARDNFETAYFLLTVIFTFLLASLAMIRSFKVLIRNEWMTTFCTSTIAWSIFFLLVGTILQLSTFFQGPHNFSVFLGASMILGSVTHLRFSYFFFNHPNHLCLLTTKSTRNFLNNWYGYILLTISAIWTGILFAIMVTSSQEITSCSKLAKVTLPYFCFISFGMFINKMLPNLWPSVTNNRNRSTSHV